MKTQHGVQEEVAEVAESIALEATTEQHTAEAVAVVDVKVGEVLPPEPKPAEIKLPEGAKVSYQDLGKERALEVAGMDDKVVALKTTLREDILKVLAGPTDSWPSYIAGFTMVIAGRETEGKDIRSLRNVKSQVTRVLGSARADLPGVKAKLEDKSKRWEVVIKELPKRSNAGRPAANTTGQPAAAAGAALPSPAAAEAAAKGEVVETNIGELITLCRKTAERLREVSIGKKSPFGEFVAIQVLDMLETSQRTYQTAYPQFVKNDKLNIQALRIHLGMDEPPAPMPAKAA